MPGVRETLEQCLLICLAWAILWLATNDELGLHGTILAVSTLFATSIVSGLISEIAQLPSLVGMLLAGFTLRNVSETLNVDLFIVDSKWSSTIRSAALVIILLRAGLGIDMDKVYRLSTSVTLLALLPNVVEATFDAGLAVSFFGMPWVFAYMLGFIVSAVSPAVVVPSLLKLKEQKYGTEKGIPDLILAAASFDDVLSISGFGICLGLAMGGDESGESELIFNIIRAPLELIIGVVGGLALGKACTYIFPDSIVKEIPITDDDGALGMDIAEDVEVSVMAKARTKRDADTEEEMELQAEAEVDTYVQIEGKDISRVLLLIGFGGLAVFGGKRLHFTGAGALCTIVTGIFSKTVWISGEGTRKIESHLKMIWTNIAQPLLFVLIGASVSISFFDGRFIGRGILLLFLGLVVRLLVSIACVWTDKFNINERLFIAMSWLPKATVQAALGAVVLDNAEQINNGRNEDQIELGRQILTLAVLAIVTTAPFGAILIAFWGPKLLDKEG